MRKVKSRELEKTATEKASFTMGFAQETKIVFDFTVGNVKPEELPSLRDIAIVLLNSFMHYIKISLKRLCLYLYCLPPQRPSTL